jgi:hypothetical protein
MPECGVPLIPAWVRGFWTEAAAGTLSRGKMA